MPGDTASGEPPASSRATAHPNSLRLTTSVAQGRTSQEIILILSSTVSEVIFILFPFWATRHFSGLATSASSGQASSRHFCPSASPCLHFLSFSFFRLAILCFPFSIFFDLYLSLLSCLSFLFSSRPRRFFSFQPVRGLSFLALLRAPTALRALCFQATKKISRQGENRDPYFPNSL